MEKAAALADCKLIYEKNDKAGHMLTLAPGESVLITTEQHLMEVDENRTADLEPEEGDHGDRE
jgi:hypothetical protein